MNKLNIPDKIHILGGPGSGKSYLAGKLSERLDVPHTDLDGLVWGKDFGTRTSSEEREANLRRITASDKWIIEGAYCSDWVRPSFEAADVILRLDMERSLQIVRLLRRLGSRALSGETSLTHARDLLGWVDGFEETTEKFPPEYAHKVIPILGKKGVSAYLENSN